MKTRARKMGNSQGVLIPKSLLAEIGLKDEVSMMVEDHALVLRPVRQQLREGWAEASRAIAEAGEDDLVWPEAEHAKDAQWQW
jgi:antitoxin MazE